MLDCTVAAKVWEKVIPPNYLSYLFNLDLLEWVITNINNDYGGNVAHTGLFAVLCWLLWKNRNKYIFQQVSSRPNKIVRIAKCFVSNIRELAMIPGSLRVNHDVKITWHLSGSRWVKINVYGSSNVNGHCLMVGGMVRDSVGKWLEGFKKYIGGVLL